MCVCVRGGGVCCVLCKKQLQHLFVFSTDLHLMIHRETDGRMIPGKSVCVWGGVTVDSTILYHFIFSMKYLLLPTPLWTCMWKYVQKIARGTICLFFINYLSHLFNCLYLSWWKLKRIIIINESKTKQWHNSWTGPRHSHKHTRAHTRTQYWCKWVCTCAEKETLTLVIPTMILQKKAPIKYNLQFNSCKLMYLIIYK